MLVPSREITAPLVVAHHSLIGSCCWSSLLEEHLAACVVNGPHVADGARHHLPLIVVNFDLVSPYRSHAKASTSRYFLLVMPIHLHLF